MINDLKSSDNYGNYSLRNILNILLSVPKTIFFNFRYLPFKQAIKLPIWLANNVRTYEMKGKIILPNKINFAMIRLGYHTIPIMDQYSTHTILNLSKGAVLEFKGTAHIGMGSKISVAKNATLILGKNFAISALSSINCYKRIVFGKDVQLSWDCLVMDSDTHKIYDTNNKQINFDKEIIIEDKTWIGCNCTILKGTHILPNTVIGANSLLSNKTYPGNCILAGQPAQSKKEIQGWIL